MSRILSAIVMAEILMQQEKHDFLRPKYGPLDTWQQISGLGRSKTYETLKTGELRGIKVGRRLLIDVEAGLAALAAMPPARVGKGEAA